MKKKLIALVLCLVLCSTVCVTASAAVQPHAMLSANAYYELVSGTRYKLSGEIESLGTDTLSLSLSLYRISGSNEISIWSISDSTTGDYLNITRTVTLIDGEKYKLVASGSGSSNSASDYVFIYP